MWRSARGGDVGGEFEQMVEGVGVGGMRVRTGSYCIPIVAILQVSER
jgi:hypothetical protein